MRKECLTVFFKRLKIKSYNATYFFLLKVVLPRDYLFKMTEFCPLFIYAENLDGRQF